MGVNLWNAANVALALGGAPGVVMVHGAFDVCHPGHLRLFREAKRHGNILVVSVSPDEAVAARKGTGHPVFRDILRADYVAELGAVNFAFIAVGCDALHSIHHVRPAIHFRGYDYWTKYVKHVSDPSKYEGNLFREMDAVRTCGGETAFAAEPNLASSTFLAKSEGLL